MNSISLVFILALIIGGYIIVGFLICIIIDGFMDVETDKYVLAILIFWPLVILIGAIFQLIHFVKTMFKGEY
ncbi:hypothetical protein [Holdemanella biformis]